MTSKDVIHSFNIHDYVVLLDAVPGRTNIVWFSPTEAGEYDIQCREYCGLIHYNMRGKAHSGGSDGMITLLSILKNGSQGDSLTWY